MLIPLFANGCGSGTTNQNQATSFCGKLVSTTAVVVGGTAAVGFAAKGGQELATMNSMAQDAGQASALMSRGEATVSQAEGKIGTAKGN